MKHFGQISNVDSAVSYCRYSETKQSGVTIITRTTISLHIFFDGSMYYIDRLLVYNNSSNRE